MIERLRQILIKEFIHLFRDKQARFSLIVPPLLQMLIFGYAATYEVNRISTAVLDLDHSQESREFLERFTAMSLGIASGNEVSKVLRMRASSS